MHDTLFAVLFSPVPYHTSKLIGKILLRPMYADISYTLRWGFAQQVGSIGVEARVFFSGPSPKSVAYKVAQSMRICVISMTQSLG
jgi:hypothetical protein